MQPPDSDGRLTRMKAILAMDERDAFDLKIVSAAYIAVTLGVVVSVRGIATRHIAGVRRGPDDRPL